MAASNSFIGKLLSPFTLSPLILGLGGAAVLWFAVPDQRPLAKFLAVAGGLGFAGTFLTMLLLGGKSVDPAVARRRNEMMTGLADLLDTSRFAACPESDRLAAAAQPERA